ncbi:hypothetical protein HYPSUDRAFT_556998 [Hypholoma sublateritium FD-334 SS-4]|uniref:Uncharacterized protein n=1 Tax=Hypholoma sublateritium (strain FD-334 SS-4) TaxID=945553 RepID=A0A0D2LRF4_HYPSF|nr:hypothetical protein HYPSUDRAFT_556998 [Hypholoma sublateritium FD-334 SS-4]
MPCSPGYSALHSPDATIGDQDIGAGWSDICSDDISQSNCTSASLSNDPVIDSGVPSTESDIQGDINLWLNRSYIFNDEGFNERGALACPSTSSSASFEEIDSRTGDAQAIHMPRAQRHDQREILSPPPYADEIAGRKRTNTLSNIWWAKDSQADSAPLSNGFDDSRPELDLWTNTSSPSSSGSQSGSVLGAPSSSSALSGASFDVNQFSPRRAPTSVTLDTRRATTSRYARCPSNPGILSVISEPQKTKNEVTFKRLQESSLSQSTIPSAKRGLTNNKGCDPYTRASGSTASGACVAMHNTARIGISQSGKRHPQISGTKRKARDAPPKRPNAPPAAKAKACCPRFRPVYAQQGVFQVAGATADPPQAPNVMR